MNRSEIYSQPSQMSRRGFLKGLAVAGAVAAMPRVLFASEAAIDTTKPVRFALIGDWGSGYDGQMAVAERMARFHAAEPFEFVVSVGDNIYPNGSHEDFGEKFERPYAPLIKHNVPFYVCFGNHDVREGADAQMRYPLFNMNGRNYYNIVRGGGMLEIFMLDSNDLDRKQVEWLDRSLAASNALWKVVVVHHPPYSSGKTHGSDMAVRRAVEPLLIRHKVPVVFSGDDHVYQRVTPQNGIQYFVTGAGGKLRQGDLRDDELVAFGNDRENHFMVIDADASELRFRAINPQGEAFDSGRIAAEPAAVARYFNRLKAA